MGEEQDEYIQDGFSNRHLNSAPNFNCTVKPNCTDNAGSTVQPILCPLKYGCGNVSTEYSAFSTTGQSYGTTYRSLAAAGDDDIGMFYI